VALGKDGMDMVIDCLDILIDWLIKSGVVSWTQGFACEVANVQNVGTSRHEEKTPIT
jgi:hypothetical protein